MPSFWTVYRFSSSFSVYIVDVVKIQILRRANCALLRHEFSHTQRILRRGSTRRFVYNLFWVSGKRNLHTTLNSANPKVPNFYTKWKDARNPNSGNSYKDSIVACCAIVSDCMPEIPATDEPWDWCYFVCCKKWRSFTNPARHTSKAQPGIVNKRS